MEYKMDYWKIPTKKYIKLMDFLSRNCTVLQIGSICNLIDGRFFIPGAEPLKEEVKHADTEARKERNTG